MELELLAKIDAASWIKKAITPLENDFKKW